MSKAVYDTVRYYIRAELCFFFSWGSTTIPVCLLWSLSPHWFILFRWQPNENYFYQIKFEYGENTSCHMPYGQKHVEPRNITTNGGG